MKRLTRGHGQGTKEGHLTPKDVQKLGKQLQGAEAEELAYLRQLSIWIRSLLTAKLPETEEASSLANMVLPNEDGTRALSTDEKADDGEGRKDGD